MRALALGAFVLDGAAAVGFVAMMALGEGRMTAINAVILAALLLGFCSALGSVMLMDDLHRHFSGSSVGASVPIRRSTSPSDRKSVV